MTSLNLAEIEDKWNACENLFDLAACCYDVISGAVPQEAVFLASYIDAGEGPGTANPNFSLLDRVQGEVFSLLSGVYYLERELKSEVWGQIKNTVERLKPFGASELENQACVFLEVLLVIDRIVYGRLKDVTTYRSDTPLNDEKKADCLVYLKRPYALLDEMQEAYRYRTPVKAEDLSGRLKAILFVRKSDWFEKSDYPLVRPLRIHEGRSALRKRLEKEKKLRIVLIPGVVPADWKTDRKGCPGRMFRISYEERSAEDDMRYCQWLRWAVRSRAHFVLFPEGSVSRRALDNIREWLRDHRREPWIRDSSLIAVFAGSTWEEDDNNVMHILDSTGEELGVYYKYSPFVKWAEGEGAGYEACEYLTAPGRKCTLLDVEMVGRILPSICRDVIDGNYTEQLVKIFEPFLVMTAACSSSTNSFHRHFARYAENSYATSVLCNACAAARESLNLCVTPRKRKTEMVHGISRIKQCGKAENTCRNSCCILLDLNYDYRNALNRKNGGPLRRFTRRTAVRSDVL